MRYTFHYDKEVYENFIHAIYLEHDGKDCTADADEMANRKVVKVTFDDGVSLEVYTYELTPVSKG